MKLNYKEVIPVRYHDVSYEKDVKEEIKKTAFNQFRKGNGLYLYGSVGAGKTHIACALIKNILEYGIEVQFFNTGDFLEKIKESFSKTSSEDKEQKNLFREIMDFKGVLVLDDIGVEKLSDWVRERLYMIINKRYEDMLPTIFTSSCDMEILAARLGDGIASRIREMSEIFYFEAEDRRFLPTNMNIQNNEK